MEDLKSASASAEQLNGWLLDAAQKQVNADSRISGGSCVSNPSPQLPDFLPTISKQVAEVRAIGQQQATDRAIASGKVTPIGRGKKS